jgi:hypothetical protein
MTSAFAKNALVVADNSDSTNESTPLMNCFADASKKRLAQRRAEYAPYKADSRINRNFARGIAGIPHD